MQIIHEMIGLSLSLSAESSHVNVSFYKSLSSKGSPKTKQTNTQTFNKLQEDILLYLPTATFSKMSSI